MTARAVQDTGHHQYGHTPQVAERGAMTTEAVIITAVLATLALAATGIIVSKVTAEARSINLS